MKLTLQCNAGILKAFSAFVVCCFISLSGFSQMVMVTCPIDTDLGTFNCTNIEDVPPPVNMLEEAMMPPYNLIITGATDITRVLTEDSGTIFYCAENDRMVTRSITIYNDLNFNFKFDPGEELTICSFSIMTEADTTPPSFTAPTAATTTCALGYEPDTTGDVTVVIDDDCPVMNVSDYVFFADAIADGSCLGELIVTRSWTSTDPCGNTSPAQTQMIVVMDDEGPVFTVPADITLACDADETDETLTGVVTDAMDECDPSSILVNSVIIPDLTQENTPCPGSTTYTKRWGAVDNCGNPTTADQTIVLLDTTPPTFDVPADVDLACGDVLPGAQDITAVDDCDPNGLTAVFIGAVVTPTGARDCEERTMVRTWTATDACGNETTQSQTITFPACVPTCNDDPCVGDVTVLGADGCSCEIVTPQVLGCTSTTACNYNPEATCEDGTCMDVPTCNVDPCVGDVTALSADSCSCELVEAQVLGCQDSTAHNYVPDANCPADCEYFDLAIIKTLSTPGPVTIGTGASLTFTITVSNPGDVTATNIVVNDIIPVGLVLNDAAWSETGGVATITIPGPLAPGADTSVDITFTLAADVTPGTVNNSVEIDSALDGDGNPTTDVDPTNDMDDEPAEIICGTPTCNTDPCAGDVTTLSADGCSCDLVEAQVIGCQDPAAHNYAPGANCAADCEYFDLALTKTLITPNPITIGSGVTIDFSITVYNQGDVTATNIEVNDFIPAGLILADANWTEAGGIATTTIDGPLAPGSDATVGISFTLDPDVTPGSLNNIAEIGGAQDGDGNPTNDIDSTPDTDPNNDTTVDDEIDNGGGDEDDNDIAPFELVCGTPTCNTDPCEGDIEGLSADGCSCVVVEPSVEGCTDPDAQNYDPNANCNTDCEYCINEAGDQSTDEIGLCSGTSTTVTASNTVVQDGSSLTYYLHDGTGATVYGISDSGTFTNNGSYPTNVTLYISAVVGPTGADGNPDLTQDCISLNLPGTPVIFFDPIHISTDVDCNMNIGMYSVSFTITGGAPTANGGSYQVAGSFYGSVNAGQQYLINGLPDGSSYSVDVIDDGNGCTASAGDGPIECIKLPIELLSYTGDVLSEGNILKWTTATEINNDIFTLERATPALEFETIATIAGNGTSSSANSYEFFDREAPNGISYYRLSQTDYDGTTVIVGIIELIRSESNIQLVNVFPMPILENVELYISSEEDQDIQLQIFNSLGELMLEQQVELKTALNKVDLNLSDLASGVYVISLLEGENVISNKVIKY